MIHYIEENWGKLTAVFTILGFILAAHSVYANGRQFVASSEAIFALVDRKNNAINAVMKDGLERAGDAAWQELRDADLQYQRELPVHAAKLLEAGVNIKADLDGEMLKGAR